MRNTPQRSDRRSLGRSAAFHHRRRYPRFFLDVDWFVESAGCSTLGRGLEISLRGVTLPVTCRSPFTDAVTLFLALPERPKMFKARCSAIMRDQGRWVLTFHEVAPADLQLLGSTLVSEYGLSAIPNLARRHGRFMELEPRHFRAASD